MTVLTAVGAAAVGMAAGSFVLLQAADANPGITGAVLLSGTVLVLLIYLIRRVQMMPSEEGIRRHDMVDRLTTALLAAEQRLDAEMQRVEARLTAAIEAGHDRESTERHRLEDRVRDLESTRARRGGV